MAAQIRLTVSVLYGLGNRVDDGAYNDGTIAAIYDWVCDTSQVPRWI